MKKKVGILTMPVKENYGGIIQAAALYHFLEEQGFMPYLVMKKYDENVLKRMFRYVLSKNPLSLIFDYKNLTKREKQSRLLKDFIRNFFTNKTSVSYNIKSYQKSVKQLDIVIVGSDQVWRFNYIRNNYPYYFLAYLPKTTKKIAYAASFGVDKWEGDKTSVTHIERFLKNFDAVSVREDSGLDICKETFGYCKATHVLDPTFLPDVSFYNELIDKKNLSKEIGLFTYVLDNSSYIEEVLTEVENKKGIKRTSIELTNYSKGIKPSIEEWLFHFREAKFVVTDSFHGVVFCILFQKQFLCVANKDRGLTRFESLLGIFGLKDRIITKSSYRTIESIVGKKIDYKIVNEKKEELQSYSKAFLINNI